LSVVAVVLALCGVKAVPRQLMYPFGPEVSDKSLPANDDFSSDEIPLRVPIVFFSSKYDSIYVRISYVE
jgi:hypothetical protein